MKVRDWHILSFVSFIIGLGSFLSTFNMDVFWQVTATIFVIGLIPVIIRRGILWSKRKIAQKKQAV